MFRATHIDGPLAGAENDVALFARSVPERLYYAPAPDPAPPVTAGHILVGYDQPPEVAWSGQVAYVLDRDASTLETGVAVYRLARMGDVRDYPGMEGHASRTRTRTRDT